MPPATLPFEVTAEELEALLEGVREGLGEAGYQKLKAAIRTLGYLTELLRERKITLEGLRTLAVRGRGEHGKDPSRAAAGGHRNAEEKPREAELASQWQSGAARTWPPWSRRLWRSEEGPVSHPSLHSGDRCPGCGQGKVYVRKRRECCVRLVGQAPITGTG